MCFTCRGTTYPNDNDREHCLFPKYVETNVSEACYSCWEKMQRVQTGEIRYCEFLWACFYNIQMI
jgi:hypothetical protein